VPNSPDIDRLIAKVESHLAVELPEAVVVRQKVVDGGPPLLLLSTKAAVVAFAFSGSEYEKTFQSLYEGFKGHVVSQGTAWDGFDISFVFCLLSRYPGTDQFGSSIETDAYFCRKFVLVPDDNLSQSLSRLPFMPLAPLHSGIERPVTAQTYLRECGVNPALARAIIVAQIRSAEGIVEDCVQGKFGIPHELARLPQRYADEIQKSKMSIRLDEVCIEDFRAYRRPQTFALGSDITVLYGPNGFGKTSFFDAIDFAMTGEIGRLEKSAQKNFQKVAHHLDSGPDDGVVSLIVRADGKSKKIVRTVRDRRNASIDGQAAERKRVLTELTRGDIPATDRIENFVSLFRATHIFSLEQQELTQGFSEECRISESIVSRMLAIQDYENGAKKASRVVEILRGFATKADGQINDLSSQMQLSQQELDRLSQFNKAFDSAEALGAEIERVRTAVEAAGIPTEGSAPDTATVRGWRTLVDSRCAKIEGRLAQMTVLASGVQALPSLQLEIDRNQASVAVLESGLTALKENFEQCNADCQLAESRLTTLRSSRNSASDRLKQLQFVAASKGELESLVGSIGRLEQDTARIEEEWRRDEIVDQRLDEATRQRQLETSEATEAFSAWDSIRGRIELLLGSLTDWQEKATHRSDLEIASEQANALLRQQLEDERRISGHLTQASEHESLLRHDLSERERNDSEIKRLLSQLTNHVDSGTCPLCGDDHESKEELLARIQVRLNESPGMVDRVRLGELQNQIATAQQDLAINRHKQMFLTGELERLGRERSQAAAQIDEVVNLARELELQEAIANSDDPRSAILERARLIDLEIERSKGNAGLLANALKELTAERAEVRKRIESKKSAAAHNRIAIRNMREKESELMKDPRFSQSFASLTSAQLGNSEAQLVAEISELSERLANSELELSTITAARSALQAEVATSTVQLQRTRTHIAGVRGLILQSESALEALGVSPSVTSDEFASRLGSESQALAKQRQLATSVTNLEISLDQATTSAALAGIQARIRAWDTERTSISSRIENWNSWCGYFVDLAEHLTKQQRGATESFAKSYGPRTSVIQQRLRTIYGFDDIHIEGDASEILVRVKRGNELLKPTDFFSQSQQQTLLLGIFLAACSSQTWSALSPVLLDDPVSHFDDMNTYAFLELISGLLSSDVGRRQFIISTCDQKLLQLAQQKFRHLDDRARFYKFTAIGADGPVVERIGQH
jgi:DNA repair protein SbcC/Rad50